MDQARVFIAIALSFLIFLAWDFFFTPKTPPKKPTQSTEEVGKVEEKIATVKPYVKEAEVHRQLSVNQPRLKEQSERLVSIHRFIPPKYQNKARRLQV